jgi:hypothetical protein
MLNKDFQRELAYLARVTEIVPIEGADRVEIAKINGWICMVGKGQFEVGDLGVFFEADSKLPETEVYSFLAKKKYKVKVQKYFKGTVISDGLLMPVTDFGWSIEGDVVRTIHGDLKEGDFLTKTLGVTYADAEDNKRKANSADKYKSMAGRHPKLFKNPIIKKIYKNKIGKRILFLFFGKKKDKKTAFPSWVVKTDEERVQNQPFRFQGDQKNATFFATEKIDGSSISCTMLNRKQKELIVCSRNVRQLEPNQKTFYDVNIYWEMAEKYHMKEVLEGLLSFNYPTAAFVTIQGEVYGLNVQKRDYGLKERRLAVFNVIIGSKDGTTKRLNPREMKVLMDEYEVPTVPIVDTNFVLPDTCDELLKMAGGESKIDGGMREGLVFRSEDGVDSFKAVSNKFLLKYH